MSLRSTALTLRLVSTSFLKGDSNSLESFTLRSHCSKGDRSLRRQGEGKSSKTTVGRSTREGPQKILRQILGAWKSCRCPGKGLTKCEGLHHCNALTSYLVFVVLILMYLIVCWHFNSLVVFISFIAQELQGKSGLWKFTQRLEVSTVTGFWYISVCVFL